MKPLLSVSLLQGSSTLSVLCIGRSASLLMSRRLLEDEPREKPLKGIPIWKTWDETFLQLGHLVACDAVSLFVNRLPREDALVLPRAVLHSINLQKDWKDLARTFHKSIRNNELRLTRKFDYSYAKSTSIEDFRTFYQEMYLPTMEGRHGRFRMVCSMDRLKEYFLRGYILKIFQGKAWVAGSLCFVQHNEVTFSAVGVRHCDARLMKQGAMGATYFATIHCANMDGRARIHLTQSSPFLEDGVLQHKRRWGTHLSVSPFLPYRSWIRINQFTPPVRQFLLSNPVILTDREDNLHGLLTLSSQADWDIERATTWSKRYDMPGIKDLFILFLDRSETEGRLVIEKIAKSSECRNSL